jgi:hypothetical protein
VALRRALIDLGMGLWLHDEAAKTYAASLKPDLAHVSRVCVIAAV